MIYHYALLWQLFTISTCFVDSSVASEAIINGDIASPNQFPYQVSLQFHDHHHNCGAGIIGDYFVLTAAHCVLVRINSISQSISILAGTNDLRRIDESAMRVRVKKVFMPIDFNPHVSATTGDIALLKLNRTLNLAQNRHLKKLELPWDKRETYAGKTAEIAGWGWDWIVVKDNAVTYGGRSGTQLLFAEARIISNNKCQETYHLQHISERQLCAKLKESRIWAQRGVCQGDSGGPLVHDEMVVGIYSKAPIGCFDNIKAAIYTRVSHYLDFIDDAMHDRHRNDMREFVLSP